MKKHQERSVPLSELPQEFEPDTKTALGVVEQALGKRDVRFLRTYSLPLFPNARSAQEQNYNRVAEWVNAELGKKEPPDVGTLRAAIRIMKQIMGVSSREQETLLVGQKPKQERR